MVPGVAITHPYFLRRPGGLDRAQARTPTITAKGLAPWSLAVSTVVRTGFGFVAPHGAIAVGDFSLDHVRAEFALGGVVGGIQQAGMFRKRSEAGLARARFCSSRARSHPVGVAPLLGLDLRNPDGGGRLGRSALPIGD